MTMSNFEIDLKILKDHAPRFMIFEKPVENVNVDDMMKTRPSTLMVI